MRRKICLRRVADSLPDTKKMVKTRAKLGSHTFKSPGYAGNDAQMRTGPQDYREIGRTDVNALKNNGRSAVQTSARSRYAGNPARTHLRGFKKWEMDHILSRNTFPLNGLDIPWLSRTGYSQIYETGALTLFPKELGHRNLQASRNGDDFIVHQIAFLIFNSRNRAAIQKNASHGQPSSQIFLRDRWFAPQPSLSDSTANNIFGCRPSRFLHGHVECTRQNVAKKSGGFV